MPGGHDDVSSAAAPPALRSACERCTADKTKCSRTASSNGACARCALNGLACEFKPARKRGPQLGWRKDGSPKRALVDAAAPSGDNDAILLANFRFVEATALKVFFAAFKSARRDGLADLDWFKAMLERVANHLSRNNPHANAALAAWLDKSGLASPRNPDACPYSPHICTWCTSLAFGAATQPAEGRLMANVMESALFAGVASDAPELSLHAFAKRGELGSVSFTVNAAFERVFGLTASDFNALVAWTGGTGLLPWGCDALLSIFASPERGVLGWLRALALQFHALGLPKLAGESVRREAPIMQVVPVKLQAGDEAQCLVRALYRETITAMDMSLDARLCFSVVEPSSSSSSSAVAARHGAGDVAVAPSPPPASSAVLDDDWDLFGDQDDGLCSDPVSTSPANDEFSLDGLLEWVDERLQ